MKLSTAALLLFAVAACQDAPDAEDTAPADTATADTMAAVQQPAVQGGLLDPDQANREQLLALPGMDPVLADSLLAARPFADMRDIDRVLAARLSEAQRDSIYARLWKPIDLNTASDDEILLIPGVGERMQREFKEYRPYRGIEDFRREMGKYVDAAEVARLEQYVAIRTPAP
jgi:DNA uptake protein ComE-like DNA-binding protein